MSAVLARMKARLLLGKDLGALCIHCKTTAIECQITFTESSERDHCCRWCRIYGAKEAHRVPTD